jgi:hypothetical protein
VRAQADMRTGIERVNALRCAQPPGDNLRLPGAARRRSLLAHPQSVTRSCSHPHPAVRPTRLRCDPTSVRARRHLR